jgi:putative endopeptidase
MRRQRSLFTLPLALLMAAAASLPAQRAEIKREYMDTTCAPCRDFFTFANGAWMNSAVIPASRRSIGGGAEAADRAGAVLKDILAAAAASYRTSTDGTTKRLGAFYASCMDSTRADREGLAPIRPELDRIDKIQSRADLARAMARLQLKWVDAAFGTMPSFASLQVRVWAYADMKDSKKNILWLYQGGMGLPERGYYTREDSSSRVLRAGYRDHIARMLVLGGSTAAQAATDAAAILAIETKLAEASLKPEETGEPALIYEPTTARKLAALAPAIDWNSYFTELGVPEVMANDAKLTASPSKFFRRLSEQLTEVPLPVWRTYLRWQLLRSVAPYLGAATAAESFRLDGLLAGTTEPPPRSSRCTTQADALMGMAIGKIYVERTFPPAAKKRVEELVANLRAVLRDRIAKNDWMGEATKKEALKKVNVVRVEVGYPSTWVDYGPAPISVDKPFVENLLALRTFEDRRHIAKLKRPVDRTEWEMSPATVNAYENPQFNALFFPAAILSPPRFGLDADDAINYGALGMVIGHELTHFFDDQGRQFDALGNLRDWWVPDDAKRYQERADIVRRQYDSYVAIDTLHLNGKLTLNENIADIGGITIAWYAFQRALAARPQSEKVLGYTPAQQFWLGTAQAWRWKARPQEMMRRVFTDGHSLAYWRINGPFSSVPEFAEAFACKPGDAMLRAAEVRARLW